MKLNLPAHLNPGSTPTMLVANPVKSFATEPFPQLAACRTPSVIGLAAQTNHLVTAMQIPVDPEFDNAKYCAISR
ncbi:hypothetical protein HB770_34600 (plasmid) [Rhizobium leguminosarum bv. viciae]|uniref:Uncharacterized protein n=1 Tax=Rhizobium leguminosarum bv. viciae TaxID=387 RepID=A0A7G6RN97_RHILV|nr:hypothetical protein HB770_34600 [Rhizobium leguminosarum bv. viciae]